MWQSHTAFPPLLPIAAVAGEIILTQWLQKITKSLSNAQTRHLLTVSSSAVLTSHDIVLQDGLMGDLEHHLLYGPLLRHTISSGCFHRHDLQEAWIVSALPVVIPAQVCVSDVWGFSSMLEPGRNKLFPDYRDLSYMDIVLSYAVCMITNILEIAHCSSGKTDSFLQSQSISIVAT